MLQIQEIQTVQLEEQQILLIEQILLVEMPTQVLLNEVLQQEALLTQQDNLQQIQEEALQIHLLLVGIQLIQLEIELLTIHQQKA